MAQHLNRLAAILVGTSLAAAAPAAWAASGGGGDGHDSGGEASAENVDKATALGVDHTYASGSPGAFGHADKQVRLVIDGDGFHPDHLEIHAGATVKFIVSNAGDQRHSFVLGTQATQQRAHNQLAAAGDLRQFQLEAPNQVVLAPGETRVMVWEFPERLPATPRTQPEFACQIGDHAAHGFKGTITMKPARADHGDAGGGGH